MTSKVLRDWLSEYKVLSKEKIGSYAASVRNNKELISSLLELFDERPIQEVLDQICHQLFEFYRSSEKELQRFVLELIPALLWLYLSFLSKGKEEKYSIGGVEAFLLSIYNLETCNSDGTPKRAYRIPVLSTSSIYHKGSHEFSLHGFNAKIHVYHDEPCLQYDAVNGQNRHSILASLLQLYHSNISSLSSWSHRILCKMCSRIVTTGFSNLTIDDDVELDRLIMDLEDDLQPSMSKSKELHPRISVSPVLLINMLTCLYYVMYNGQTGPGARTIMDIHNRATYELYADVLLVTNAIRHLLKETTFGQLHDRSVGLNLPFSPPVDYTFSKTAITNASFKAKKLPDDIPLQPNESGKLSELPKEDTMTKKKAKSKKSHKKKTKESRMATQNTANIKDVMDIVQSPHDKTKINLDAVELSSISKFKEMETSAAFHLNKNVLSSKFVTGSKNSAANKDKKNTEMITGHTLNSSGGSKDFESTDL